MVRGKGREEERELKVSAADSAEENKKLKCLAISAKRVKMPVSTHFNISDDPAAIRVHSSRTFLGCRPGLEPRGGFFHSQKYGNVLNGSEADLLYRKHRLRVKDASNPSHRLI